MVVFCTTLMGCGSGDNNSSKNGKGVTYSEDLKFLPIYPNSKKVSYTPAESKDHMGKLIYTVDENDLDVVTKNYSDLLKKDKWEVTKDKDSNFLDCKKGDHIAAILITTKDNTTNIDILAK